MLPFQNIRLLPRGWHGWITVNSLFISLSLSLRRLSGVSWLGVGGCWWGVGGHSGLGGVAPGGEAAAPCSTRRLIIGRERWRSQASPRPSRLNCCHTSRWVPKSPQRKALSQNTPLGPTNNVDFGQQNSSLWNYRVVHFLPNRRFVVTCLKWSNRELNRRRLTIQNVFWNIWLALFIVYN